MMPPAVLLLPTGSTRRARRPGCPLSSAGERPLRFPPGARIPTQTQARRSLQSGPVIPAAIQDELLEDVSPREQAGDDHPGLRLVVVRPRLPSLDLGGRGVSRTDEVLVLLVRVVARRVLRVGENGGRPRPDQAGVLENPPPAVLLPARGAGVTSCRMTLLSVLAARSTASSSGWTGWTWSRETHPTSPAAVWTLNHPSCSSSRVRISPRTTEARTRASVEGDSRTLRREAVTETRCSPPAADEGEESSVTPNTAVKRT